MLCTGPFIPHTQVYQFPTSQPTIPSVLVLYSPRLGLLMLCTGPFIPYTQVYQFHTSKPTIPSVSAFYSPHLCLLMLCIGPFSPYTQVFKFPIFQSFSFPGSWCMFISLTIIHPLPKSVWRAGNPTFRSHPSFSDANCFCNLIISRCLLFCAFHVILHGMTVGSH